MWNSTIKMSSGSIPTLHPISSVKSNSSRRWITSLACNCWHV